jgi:hypothetical protein
VPSGFAVPFSREVSSRLGPASSRLDEAEWTRARVPLRSLDVAKVDRT